MEVELSLRWRLGRNHLVDASEELFNLLRAVRDLGSVSAAARQSGVSYRHAWGMLTNWASHFGHTLVVMERGRGTRLSLFGESLLAAEREARARAGPVLRELEHELAVALAQAVPADSGDSRRLRVFASHSLVLETLTRLLASKGLKLDLHFRGSIESLRLLSAGRCDIAGFHIADPPLADALHSHYRPWLSARNHRLIRVVTRRQGLIVGAGNPHNIRSLQDLTKKNIRFINRQPDSGTRLLLDLLLARAGIDPESISGYDTEEFTHVAVAALVAGNIADAAPGIQAAADRFALGFIQLAHETYYLAVRKTSLTSPTMQRLLETLRSAEFARGVTELGGYEADGAGEELTVDEVITRTINGVRFV